MNKDFLFSRRNIGLKRRYRAECRFRAYGVIAIFIGLFFYLRFYGLSLVKVIQHFFKVK